MRWLWRVGLVVLGLGLILIAVGPALVKPVGKRLAIVERPADYGLAAEDVTFAPTDRPIALRAWWIAGPAPRAALVFVHGGGDDNRSLPYGNGLALARDLVAHRYALLMMDLRNFGESDGTPEGITYGDLETNDVLGAVGAIAVKVPGLPIGAIGFSMGGATVLRAATREPRIRAVVADSAPADLRDVSVAFVHAATGMPNLLAGAFVWSAEHLHGTALGRGGTVTAIAGATLPPVLLIHDAHDPIVPPDQIRRLAAAIPSATVWETSAADASPFGTHIQSYRLGPEAYVARVAAFLEVAFGGGDPR
jgi:uncharacterized protein